MKLNPEYLKSLRAEQSKLAEVGMTPKDKRPQAIVRTWQATCPKLTRLLKAAGVLELAASVLDHQVHRAVMKMPGEVSENRQVAEREMIPHDPATEAQFLSQITLSDAKTIG